MLTTAEIEQCSLDTALIGKRIKVIVPAYTYTATASAAIHCGAKVIFVDTQKDPSGDHWLHSIACGS